MSGFASIRELSSRMFNKLVRQLLSLSSQPSYDVCGSALAQVRARYKMVFCRYLCICLRVCFETAYHIKAGDYYHISIIVFINCNSDNIYLFYFTIYSTFPHRSGEWLGDRFYKYAYFYTVLSSLFT